MRRSLNLALLSSSITCAGCNGFVHNKEYDRLVYAEGSERIRLLRDVSPAVRIEVFLYANEDLEPPRVDVGPDVAKSGRAEILAPLTTRLQREKDEGRILLLLELAEDVICANGGSIQDSVGLRALDVASVDAAGRSGVTRTTTDGRFGRLRYEQMQEALNEIKTRCHGKG